MSKKALALMLIVAAGGGFIYGVVFNRTLTSTTVQAQRETTPRTETPSEPPRSDTRKWEYCAITRASQSPSIARGVYAISYFRPAGVQVVSVDESASERGALPKAIARLGEDGWELVGEGPLEFRANIGGEALYFKRRRP